MDGSVNMDVHDIGWPAAQGSEDQGFQEVENCPSVKLLKFFLDVSQDLLYWLEVNPLYDMMMSRLRAKIL